MSGIATPVRLEPAFPDREAVRALFRTVPRYQAAAAYLPDGSDDTGEARPAAAVLPWFRETWALGGEARLPGAEAVLHNPAFLAAAQRLFPGARLVPRTVVVNVNPPMPAGVPHVDVPSFRGATREHLPLRLLIAMGASGLFEAWRVVEAGAIAWFYEGEGGAFDYWPDGPRGPRRSERPPFGNLALVADNDRMWHRIGRVGPPGAGLPEMTAAAEIRPVTGGGWAIVEGGEVRARYPGSAVRLSLLWKAEVEPEGAAGALGPLGPDRIREVLGEDLARRGAAGPPPAGALQDPAWVDLAYRTYRRLARAAAPPADD